MADFNIDVFAEDPEEGLRASGSFRKATWSTITDHYSVDVRRGATKQEIKEAVLNHLRAMEIEFDDQEQELRVAGDLELKRLQIELRFRQTEAEKNRERERERESK